MDDHDCSLYVLSHIVIPITVVNDNHHFDVDVNEFKYMYVGITNDIPKRWEQHFNNSLNPLYKWSRKLYNRLFVHGWKMYNKTVVRTNMSREEAKTFEIEMIAKYRSFELGMNSTPGGDNIGSGSDHPLAQAINLYNNKTGEIFSFLWIGGAAVFLGIETGLVSQTANPNHTSEQTFSKKQDNTWFQVHYAYDTTPFVENMPTRYEKMAESKRKKIVVVNLDTHVEEEFDNVELAATAFDILKGNIFNVLFNGECKQFNVKHGIRMGRYDAQYLPKTREFNFDILPGYEARTKASEKAVIAYNEDNVIVYDFVSATKAAEFTMISRSSISGCATHSISHAGRSLDDQQLRWEFKDPEKLAMYERLKPRNVKR
jgi:predicted GIY-YIG superfamily endonuclease